MDISIISSWDRRLFLLVNHNWGLPWLDDLMLLISSEKAWLVVGLVFWVVCHFCRHPLWLRILWVGGVTIAFTDLFCFRLVKPLLHRLRPCYQMDVVRLLEASCGSDYGLPSNHAANSMAFVVVILSLTRNWRWLWLLALPIVVGISRAYVGVHFPLDVLFGFLIGGLTAWVVSAFFFWKESDILRVLNRVRRGIL